MSKTLGIVANIDKPQALRVIDKILPWARRKGYRVVVHEELRGARLTRLSNPPVRAGIMQHRHYGNVKQSDLILTLGGDGVLLHAATTLYPCAVPILAVNLGSLGFNAQTAPRTMFQLIETFFAGKAVVQRRCMLLASVLRGGRKIFHAPVLNDVAVAKELQSRLINLCLLVNGAYVTEYRTDGLIISTPTGSTAYNLATGGPILYPSLDAIVVSPLCPHTLSVRALVLPADCKIEIIFEQHKDREEAAVGADGQRWQALRSGDRVEVVRAAEPLHLVLNPAWDYFETLRTKLRWGGSLDV